MKGSTSAPLWFRVAGLAGLTLAACGPRPGPAPPPDDDSVAPVESPDPIGSPGTTTADPATAACRITDEQVQRLEELVVTVEGIEPFRLYAEDVAVVAGFDGDATPGVRVRGRLEFVAAAPGLPLRTTGGLVSGTGVTLGPDSSILRATADADGLLADISIGREVTVHDARLPCAGLEVDVRGRESWDTPATEHGGPALFPASLPLLLADGPTAEPTMVVAVSTDGDPEYHPDYLPFVELDAQGDRVLVSLEWYGGASLSGWAPREAFVAGTVQMGFGGPSGGGEGSCPGLGRCGGSTVYCGPADVATGAVVHAEAGTGPWATVLDGAQLEVQAVVGEEWVRVRGVPGLAERERCGALEHAWVARDKVRLPDDEPRPRPGACEDGTTGVVTAPQQLEVDCGGRPPNGCPSVAVPVLVRNCSAEPVDLVQIEFGPADGGTILRQEPEPARARLAPGERFEGEILWQPGSYELRTRVRTEDGFPVETAPVVVEIRDPEREAAIAACRECDGTWGQYGIMGFEGCDCTARDAGRACTSDAECEGRCMFDGWVQLADDDPEAAAAPACAQGEQRYIARGTCSERTMIFGCVSVLGETSYDCRRPGLAGRAPTTCID